jgi:phage-related protein
MTNIDLKIRLILRLNSKLKKIELYLNNSKNVPLMFQNDVNKAIKNHFTMQTVLKNLNYLNY